MSSPHTSNPMSYYSHAKVLYIITWFLIYDIFSLLLPTQARAYVCADILLDLEINGIDNYLCAF